MTSATVGAIDIVAWFVYLFSAVLFVVGLHFMNSPKTARKGNQISAFGMVVAVLMAFIVLFAKGFVNIVAVVVLVVGFLYQTAFKKSVFSIPDIFDSGANGTSIESANCRSSKPLSRPESPGSTSNSH